MTSNNLVPDLGIVQPKENLFRSNDIACQLRACTEISRVARMETTTYKLFESRGAKGPSDVVLRVCYGTISSLKFVILRRTNGFEICFDWTQGCCQCSSLVLQRA